MVRVPTPKKARIAPYLVAVEKARKAGWSWEDIRLTLQHLNIDTSEKVRLAYRHALVSYKNGTLEADQLPLPKEDSKIQLIDQDNMERASNNESIREPEHGDMQSVQESNRPQKEPTLRDLAEELGFVGGKNHKPNNNQSRSK